MSRVPIHGKAGESICVDCTPSLLYPFFTTLLQFLNALLANKGLLN